jgi:hypothetical protein
LDVLTDRRTERRPTMNVSTEPITDEAQVVVSRHYCPTIESVEA